MLIMEIIQIINIFVEIFIRLVYAIISTLYFILPLVPFCIQHIRRKIEYETEKYGFAYSTLAFFTK